MHIRVKVYPGSKKEQIKKISSEKFECYVKEKPERNVANKKALEMLAIYLGVEKRKLKLVSGHHSSSKIIMVKD